MVFTSNRRMLSNCGAVGRRYRILELGENSAVLVETPFSCQAKKDGSQKKGKATDQKNA
jgi:hypothetical protein